VAQQEGRSEMRRLDRTIATIPACLAGFAHGRDSWSDIDGVDRAEIRASLEQMQGRRCAYCEGDVDTLGQHIEHFKRKSLCPALTFDWSNLYWSCDQQDSCGRFKDHWAGPYNVADVVDPCADEPDAFFRFRADGTISIRIGLTENQLHKASETLRVLGLNGRWGRLRNMRKRAVAGYLASVDDAITAGFRPEDLKEYFEEALRIAATLPFSTVVRHVLSEGA
jgi:uncharacterized protein (TIGR02646 family)